MSRLLFSACSKYGLLFVFSVSVKFIVHLGDSHPHPLASKDSETDQSELPIPTLGKQTCHMLCVEIWDHVKRKLTLASLLCKPVK